MSPICRIVLLGGTVLAALIGLVKALPDAFDSVERSDQPPEYAVAAEYVLLPHHIPKYRGGVTFRFAMVHDVIHERFARHGAAYYRERNRLTREKLAMLPAGDPGTFPLADDLAAGLERLGQSAEAAEVMRDKLARQTKAGLSGRALYTSYANLGTFLIHASFKKAVGGDPEAQSLFREGVGFIRQSVAVNPEAHFGREQWQLAIAEFLLATMAMPDLLRQFDCLGNCLEYDPEQPAQGRAYYRPFGPSVVKRARLDYQNPEVPAVWDSIEGLRDSITRVGAENNWIDIESHLLPVAFDEPMLGIIGMWRQGGGANPHFALALGETMLRVGQRYLAWAAFERASRLADRYWPDPALQQFLRDHCSKRQQQIQKDLASQSRKGTGIRLPASPTAETGRGSQLRDQFDAELKMGEAYQRDYQTYEEKQLAAGVSLDAATFEDAFHATHEPIESPVGPEEWLASVPEEKAKRITSDRKRPWAIFCSGLAALVTALVLRGGIMLVFPDKRGLDK